MKRLNRKKENTFALGTLEILETNKAHICKYMCLAFMQSEHMRELLFTIHPVFFNLTTPDAVEGQRRRVSQQGGHRGWTWGRWDPAVASPRPRLTLDQPAAASSSLELPSRPAAA